MRPSLEGAVFDVGRGVLVESATEKAGVEPAWMLYARERASDPRGYFSRLRKIGPVDFDEGIRKTIDYFRMRLS